MNARKTSTSFGFLKGRSDKSLAGSCFPAAAPELVWPNGECVSQTAVGDWERMQTTGDAQAKAASTYNSASDHYDAAANSFWERFGRRTIERLALPRGAGVLDVCCGSGASAIAAAMTVGESGSVIGVDLAENLLTLARGKARRAGLTNIEFRLGDMLALTLPQPEFDAVVCVFGIFFVPDMPKAIGELWRLVAPRGKLAVTTWGPRLFEPANTAFWNSIRDLRPDLYKDFNPWDRICNTESLRALFAEAGLEAQEVVLEPGTHALKSAEDWWSVVLGSGYRGTIDLLDRSDREQVQQRAFAFIRESRIREVETNVIYGVATKPPR